MGAQFIPTWKEHEEKISSNNPKEALKAAEAFDITRRKELATNRRARSWEKGRKESIAKDKPVWIKEQEGKEKEAETAIITKIKNFGTIDSDLRPYRGFILIKTIEPEVQKSKGGIFLSTVPEESNIAEVVAVGNPLNLGSQGIVEAGVSPKDKVMIKKFSGIDVETKQGKCKLIQFSDILGVLE